MTDTQIKEVAVQLANVAISAAANEDLTGEEKERRVIEFLVKLDDGLPLVGFISNELEADLLDLGVDKVQEYIAKLDIKAFVKKQYNRIKHIFKK